MSRVVAVFLLAILALGASCAPAGAAAKPGTFAGTLGVKVPKGATASVRAIDGSTGDIAGVRDVGRSGRFSLSLHAGRYLVVGTVTAKSGKTTVKRIGVSLKAGQKRKGAKLTARKRKKARAAFVQELGNVTPGRIALGVFPFTGTTGDIEYDTFSRGLVDLFTTDILQGVQKCGGVSLVEIARRADVIKELEFQQSPYVDPSTRLTRNFILQDLELHGTLHNGAGGQPEIVSTLTEKSTGREVGTYRTPVENGNPFDAEQQMAQTIVEDLCKLSDVYEVTLDIAGDGRFATHNASGTIHQVLRARRADRKQHVWTATGPLQWSGVSFTSKTSPCVMIDPVVPVVAWGVKIEDLGEDQLKLTWTINGNDMPTGSMDCPPGGPDDPDPPPQPGLPGPALLNTQPGAFTLPYAGGSQPLSGGVSDGDSGFFNTGTMTVVPSGVG